MTANKIEFFYGAENRKLDVTVLASSVFIKQNQLIIVKSVSFNDLFGDVAPNEHKTLQILFRHNNTKVELSEARPADYSLDIDVKVCSLPVGVVQYQPSSFCAVQTNRNERVLPNCVCYNREEALTFIQQNFADSEVAFAFRKCNGYAMQRNMFCYCFLYVNGGFFVDCNTTCSKLLLDELVKKDLIEMIICLDSNGVPCNEFMGSRPLNVALRKIIDECVTNVLNETSVTIADVTGCHVLQRHCAAVYGILDNLDDNSGLVTIKENHGNSPLVIHRSDVGAMSSQHIFAYLDLRALLRVDNIFVLNLAKRVDRLEQCRREFRNLCIQNSQWERFEACLGADVGIQNRFSAEFEQFCAKQSLAVTSTLGGFGCLLSHYQMIKTARECGYRRVLILEDDFAATSQLSNLELLAKIGAAEFDMFYLSMNVISPSKPTSDPDICIAGRIFSTGAYIVNCSIFDFICAQCFVYAKQIDVFYADIVQRQCNVLCTKNSLIIQRESFSDIEQQTVNYFK